VQYTEVLNDAEYIYADEKTGDLLGRYIGLNTGQRLQQQPKHTNPNKHTCAA